MPQLNLDSGTIETLDFIRARTRLLELALAGAESTGLSIDGGIYHDAIMQCIDDIARQLDAITESEKHLRKQPIAA